MKRPARFVKATSSLSVSLLSVAQHSRKFRHGEVDEDEPREDSHQCWCRCYNVITDQTPLVIHACFGTPCMRKGDKVTCSRKCCGEPVATGNIDLEAQCASKVGETDQAATRTVNPPDRVHRCRLRCETCAPGVDVVKYIPLGVCTAARAI